MNIVLFIIFGLAAAVIIYLILIFNNLVTLKHSVAKAWANIDVLLAQRHDELPRLVEVCKQYMTYEQETLRRVMQARSAVAAAREQNNVAALGPAETQLRGGLGNLFALSEGYPDLKANENFRHLQFRITEMENAIADRRELYNEIVNLNNIRIEQFPDIIIATLFNFNPKPLLVFRDEEVSDVKIKSLFD